MRVLLDTHAFVWWACEPAKLSAAAEAAFLDPSIELLLSVVSVWEIVIKLQLGKLTLSGNLAAIVGQQQANGIDVLPVTLEHVLAVEQLPTFHRDPFDRLLIAQAIVEGASVMTKDSLFSKYPVKLLW